jgi:GNAT superfamily N-acetyltransferase
VTSSLDYNDDVPGVDEFIRLRTDAGLSAKTREAATRGLGGTCYSVCVRDRGRLVGMGRVIGDGGCFFQVVDIAVHPGYQRRGIGIMTRLMAQLRAHAPASAYVSLIADGHAARLYEKFGFEPTAPASVGMALRL